jgi:1-acyl-sn-glycerol-3-phosphate acyltransferase
MLKKIRFTLQGIVVLVIVAASTIVVTLLILILAFFKKLSPEGAARIRISRWLSTLGECWVSVNQCVSWIFHNMQWDISLPSDLEHEGRYLVFCNHNSWVDILVLQHSLNRRVPFMRFLLKQELIWVPFLGLAWWALDMAFLRRYSRQQLLRNPELRGKDLENAARACEKLKNIPVSMMTFPEGTRFTLAKKKQQNSPYRFLLRPRYGGVGQILYSFDDALDKLIDVTIFYPDGTPNLWQFVSGQVRNISVQVKTYPISAGLRGKNFRQDALAKNSLREWLSDIFEAKDKILAVAGGQVANSAAADDGLKP